MTSSEGLTSVDPWSFCQNSTSIHG